MDVQVADKARRDGSLVACTGWRFRIQSAVLRGWARYLGDSVPPRIRDLDLTPHGVPGPSELKRRAERAELRVASLHQNGPSHSRPVWEQDVREAEATVNDLWRRWADATFR